MCWSLEPDFLLEEKLVHLLRNLQLSSWPETLHIIYTHKHTHTHPTHTHTHTHTHIYIICVYYIHAQTYIYKILYVSCIHYVAVYLMHCIFYSIYYLVCSDVNQHFKYSWTNDL